MIWAPSLGALPSTSRQTPFSPESVPPVRTQFSLGLPWQWKRSIGVPSLVSFFWMSAQLPERFTSWAAREALLRLMEATSRAAVATTREYFRTDTARLPVTMLWGH